MKVVTHKQRALLYTIDRLSEKRISSKFMIVKNLFLLAEEEKMNAFIKFYNFYPYKYGPFSNECYSDLSKLQQEGYIKENNKKLELTEKGKDASKTTDKKAKFRINRVTSRFSSSTEIKDYVYQKYPQYTTKSELLPKGNNSSAPDIFTIGYEGRDIDQFLNLLIQNNIETLIDVRKNPFSMKFFFTKNKLSSHLENVGIKYIHIPELGIEGDERQNLLTIEDYKILFDKYQKTTIIQEQNKIEDIIKIGKSNRIALMCFEADINTCHRGIIAKEISKLEQREVKDI